MKNRIYLTILAAFVFYNIGCSQTYSVFYKSYSERTDGNLIDLAKKLEKQSVEKSIKPDRVLTYSDGESMFGALHESDMIEDEENSNEYKISSTKVLVENTYKNHKENVVMVEYIEMFAFIGEEDPIVKSKLDQHTWQLSDQSRTIAGYLCKLATTVDTDGNKVFAWYTDKIGINEGPGIYCGLPGLILQLQIGEKLLYTATSIKQNNKKTKIRKPDGNIMNQKEFDIYVKEILKPRTVTTPDGRVITISGSNN